MFTPIASNIFFWKSGSFSKSLKAGIFSHAASISDIKPSISSAPASFISVASSSAFEGSSSIFLPISAIFAVTGLMASAKSCP